MLLDVASMGSRNSALVLDRYSCTRRRYYGVVKEKGKCCMF